LRCRIPISATRLSKRLKSQFLAPLSPLALSPFSPHLGFRTPPLVQASTTRTTAGRRAAVISSPPPETCPLSAVSIASSFAPRQPALRDRSLPAYLRAGGRRRSIGRTAGGGGRPVTKKGLSLAVLRLLPCVGGKQPISYVGLEGGDPDGISANLAPMCAGAIDWSRISFTQHRSFLNRDIHF
jgi:hypothetical protein